MSSIGSLRLADFGLRACAWPIELEVETVRVDGGPLRLGDRIGVLPGQSPCHQQSHAFAYGLFEGRFVIDAAAKRHEHLEGFDTVRRSVRGTATVDVFVGQVVDCVTELLERPAGLRADVARAAGEDLGI